MIIDSNKIGLEFWLDKHIGYAKIGLICCLLNMVLQVKISY